MGEVYEAHEITLDRRVALKVVSHDNSGDHDSDDLIRRFMQEARTLAKVNHPNIVTIHAIQSSSNTQYIAMEYVEGVSLKEFLDEYTMPPEIALFLFEQMLSGLKRLHEHNIVHRDLKPSNILIRADGQIKILDFGIAKSFDAHVNTNPGVAVGTPPYMAPELRNFKAASSRSDFWSLGAIFFECLTGKLLVLFLEGNEFKFSKADLKLIPEEMRAIIGGMSAPAQDDRYRTASEIIDDVGRFRDTLGQPTAASLATFRDQLKYLVDSKRPKGSEAVPPPVAPVFDIDYSSGADRMESSIRKLSQTPAFGPRTNPPVPESRSSMRKRRNKRAYSAVVASVMLGVALYAGLKFKNSAPAGIPVTRTPSVSPDPVPRPQPAPPVQQAQKVQLREPADRQLIWLEPAQNPTLTWSRVLSAREYDLQIALDSDFRKIIVNEPVNGNSYLPAKPLPEGVYYWRLSPVSGGKAVKAQNFTLSRLEPVLLIKPIAGQIVEAAGGAGTTADFEWACRLGARLYNVQIATDPEFQKVAASNIVSSCRWNNVKLAPGNYFWRVRLEIGPGYREIWSTMRQLVVTGPAKVEKLVDLPAPQIKNPKQVQILAAASKSRGPAQTMEKWVELSWNKIAGARGYQIQVAQSKDFSDVFLDEKTKEPKFKWRATSPGQVYWRVRAVNSGGQGGRSSSPGQVTLLIPAPVIKPTFKFVLPTEGEAETPFVEWRPTPQTAMYLVQMGGKRELAGMKERPMDEPRVEMPAAPGRYFIRVAAAASDGTAISPFSNVASVVITQELNLEAPRPMSPSSGAAAPSKNGRISIEFSWSAVPKAESYALEVSSDAAFTEVLERANSGEPRTLLEQAELSGRVYWRVKALGGGKSSPWSESYHFDVK